MAEDIAKLLVSAGLVPAEAAQAARAEHRRLGGSVVEHLVLLGAVEDEELTEFFRTRLLFKRVDPNSLVGLPPEVRDVIPAQMACALRVMPVEVNGDGNLTAVFSDPTDDSASQELSYHTGLYVVRAVSTQLQLAWCLGHYYDFISPLGETLIVPPEETAVRPRRRGVTDAVNAMRKRVMVPDGDDDEPASAEWIARRANELKRELHGVPHRRDDANQRPAMGEVQAQRESKMIPRHAVAEADLPAVMVGRGVEAEAAGNARDKTTRRQKFFAPPPGSDDDSIFDDSTRRLVFVDPSEPDDSTRRPEPIDPARLNDDDEGASLRQVPLTAEQLAQVAAEVSVELESAVAARPGELPASKTARESADRREDTAKTQKIPAPPVREDESDSGGDTRETVKMSVSELRSAGVVESEQAGTDSRPILLTQSSTDDKSGDDTILLLDRPKRAPRATRAGVAPASSQTRGVAQTRGGRGAYTGGDAAEATSPIEPLDDDDMTTRKLPKSTVTASEVDDGWGDDDLFGPPGTTIPPDFLGASEEQADSGGGETIPLQVSEAEPSDATAAAEPPAAAGKRNGEPARKKRSTAPPSEDDTARLTETVKELGQTDDRNTVFSLLMDFMAGTHERVAFFAVKKGKVCAWKHKNLDAANDDAEVALAQSQTLGHIIENQTPYRGTDVDAATAQFLTDATGAAPEDIIAAPVAIGPRVIGILYGDAPTGTLFDQQVTMVTQSAGLALQRILQAAKKK